MKARQRSETSVWLLQEFIVTPGLVRQVLAPLAPRGHQLREGQVWTYRQTRDEMTRTRKRRGQGLKQSDPGTHVSSLQSFGEQLKCQRAGAGGGVRWGRKMSTQGSHRSPQGPTGQSLGTVQEMRPSDHHPSVLGGRHLHPLYIPIVPLSPTVPMALRLIQAGLSPTFCPSGIPFGVTPLPFFAHLSGGVP